VAHPQRRFKRPRPLKRQARRRAGPSGDRDSFRSARAGSDPVPAVAAGPPPSGARAALPWLGSRTDRAPTSMPAGMLLDRGELGGRAWDDKVVEGDTEGPRWDIQQPRFARLESKVRCAGSMRASRPLVRPFLRNASHCRVVGSEAQCPTLAGERSQSHPSAQTYPGVLQCNSGYGENRDTSGAMVGCCRLRFAPFSSPNSYGGPLGSRWAVV
jgi:hypothetical protein